MKTITSMKLAFTLAAAAIMSTTSAYADDSLAKLKELGEIRIANTQTSPPWTYLNDQNKPDGYDVAVAQEVAKRIGIAKVVFVADTYKSFVEGLKTNKYDMVMNSLTPNPERRLQVDFSDPYGVEEFRIWVLEKNTDIHERADLAGKSIGVPTGTTNESWSRKHLTESEIRTYDNSGLVFNDLATGRTDVAISSYFSGVNYKKSLNIPIKAVGAPQTYQLSAAALPKGQDSLKVAVNKAIAGMIADGTLDTLTKKYIGDDYHMIESINKAKAEE